MPQVSDDELREMLDIVEPGERQKLVIQLRLSGRSIPEIATHLKVNERTITRCLANYIKRVRSLGYDPRAEKAGLASEGYHVRRKSVMTHTDEGMKWVISEPDKDARFKRMIDAIEAAAMGIKPLKVIKAPKKVLADLCTTYVITDFHLAMYAFGPETGDNWDVHIATRTFATGLQEMMDGSPDSEVGLFVQGGDFLHWDSLAPVTPMSGHIVDADTRADLMVEVALQMHIHAVGQMLAKHKKVRVIAMEGNHDMMGSIWIRKCLRMFYRNNKRVEIDDTAFPYYAYLHGNIMLGFHHGHKKTNKELPALFSCEPRYRTMWGAAKYCYIHTGHYHKREQDVTEYGGAIVERHPTLAARDAYAARGGWVSWRAANAITYHKDKGEVSRKVVYPEVSDGN